MTRRQGQENFSFFCDKFFAFEQSRVGSVMNGQLLIVGKEPLVELSRYLLRGNALIDRDIQRMPALFTLVGQPDIQLVLIGVDPEAPGVDEDHLPPTAGAFVDHPIFFFV